MPMFICGISILSNRDGKYLSEDHPSSSISYTVIPCLKCCSQIPPGYLPIWHLKIGQETFCQLASFFVLDWFSIRTRPSIDQRASDQVKFPASWECGVSLRTWNWVFWRLLENGEFNNGNFTEKVSIIADLCFKCHCLRKCSRGKKLWSTVLAETWHRSWVWWDISKATSGSLCWLLVLELQGGSHF